MAGRKRSIKQLRKQLNNVEDFNEFSKKVVLKFANTECRRSDCSEQFNISKDCFYQLVDYSIIENIIDAKIVERVIRKIIEIQKDYQRQYRNCTQNNKVEYYKELKRQRYEKILSSLSNERIKEISEHFAIHVYASKERISEFYEIEIQVLDLILKKAIIENIVDNRTFKLIKERSLYKDNSKRAIEIFDQLYRLRENNKNKVT